ncbi:arsenate reductase-like glutaredoxin family protein [Bosea sp. OAE752]
MDVVTDYNPACGISRNAPDLIRDASVEPHVVECPETPPTQALLKLLE